MKSFGLLSYNATDNVGDEIQSIAARRFLPKVDYHIDREGLHLFQSRNKETVNVIMNGWFCHYPIRWPPSRYIRPIFTSFHLSPAEALGFGLRPTDILLSDPRIEYLRFFGPIGARDLHTMRTLQEAGVDSYFSGCLTLTLERPETDRYKDLIVLCDVPTEVSEYVKKANPTSRVVPVTHAGFNSLSCNERFAKAERLLKVYASARIVITTRLHCALPCTAIETPVLLLDTAPDQNRFDGLSNFVRHCTVSSFISGQSSDIFEEGVLAWTAHYEIRNKLITDVQNALATNSLEEKGYPFDIEMLMDIQSSYLDLVASKIDKLEMRFKGLGMK